MFAFQVVDRETQSRQQAEDDACGVKLPRGGILCARNEYHSHQTQPDRDGLDPANSLFVHNATQDRGHGRGGECPNGRNSRPVVLNRKCPHRVEDGQRHSIEEDELPVRTVKAKSSAAEYK